MAIESSRAANPAKRAWSCVGKLWLVLISAISMAVAPGIAIADGDTAANSAGGAGTFAAGTRATINSASGSSNVSIPLELLQARGRPQPSLSLNYDSNRQMGNVAVGWSLGPASIERTGVGGGPPLLNDTDRYAYGGSPLVKIGTVTSTSCPVPNCNEVMPYWSFGWTYYRLQDEGPFVRFFRTPEGQTWRAQQRDGQVLEFGKPLIGPDAFVPAALDEAIDVEGSIIVRWNLSRQYEALDDGMYTNWIAYVWRHLVLPEHDRVLEKTAVLTDIFDTPPLTGTLDVSGFAHHVRIHYGPHEVAPSFWTNARAWGHASTHEVSWIDITTKSTATDPRVLVRRYTFEKMLGLGRPYLRAIGLTGHCLAYEEEGLEWSPHLESHRRYWDLNQTVACPSLPPITFEYTDPLPNQTWGLAYDTLRASPGGPSLPQHPILTPADATVTDFDGDGRADVVYVPSNPTTPTAFFGELYIRRLHLEYSPLLITLPFTNTSGTPFGLSKKEITIPGQWSVNGGASTLWLNENTSIGISYFLRTGGYGTSSWTLASDPNAPQQAWPYPILLGGDVNGDGIGDVIIQNNEVCFGTRDVVSHTIKAPAAQSGSGRPCISTGAINTNIVEGPFSTLADMNGDGILDLVRSTNTDADYERIYYIPGTGNANPTTGVPPFGCDSAQPYCLGSVDVTQLNEDLKFDRTGHGTTLVGDVTGDGFADIVQIYKDGAFTKFDRWERTVTGGYARTFQGHNVFDPQYALPAKAFIADVHGTGVNSLVFVGQGYQAAFSFHDPGLNQWEHGPKPGLLRRILNASGGETKITYRSLAELEHDQSMPGHIWYDLGPWSRHAPVPMIVTTRVETTNGLPEPIGTATATEFDFRNPIYDPWEGRVVGFERVRVTELGDSRQLPLATDTTYFVGDCPSTFALATCSHTLDVDFDRGLVGRPVLVERYDANQHIHFSSEHIKYAEHQLFAPGTDSRPVTFVYPYEEDEFIFDTTSGAQSGSWNTADLVYNGSPTWSRFVPLYYDQYAHTKRQYTYDNFGNFSSSVDSGRVTDAGTAIDRPIVSSVSHSLVGGDGWTWRATVSSTTYGSGGTAPVLGPDAPARVFYYDYDVVGRLKRTTGLLLGTLPLLREGNYGGPAPAPPNASQNGYVVLGEYEYDTASNLILIKMPGGTCRRFHYENEYGFMRDRVLSGSGTCLTGSEFSTEIVYDRVFGQPEVLVDPTGARTEMDYDFLGRLTSVRAPSTETLGASVADVSLEYLESTDGFHKPIVHSLGRGGESWTYLDGNGEPYLSLRPADDGDPGQYIASGLSAHNRRGAPFDRKRPWYYSGSPLAHGPTTTAPVVATTRRDALGRIVEAENALGEKSKLVYAGLTTEVWDAEDLDSGSPHVNTPGRFVRDGHGRTIESVARTDGNADQITTRASYTFAGNIAGVRRSHLSGGESYVRWARYDGFGRMVENAEPHSTWNFAANWSSIGNMRAPRYAYDNAGRLVGTNDGRGCGENLHYDVLGRLIGEDYSPCSGTNRNYTTDFEVKYRYDTPEPGQSADYGNFAALRGRLTSVQDRGTHTRYAYDARGRVVGVARRIRNPGLLGVTDPYATHWFRKSISYDLFDRQTGASTGAESPELAATTYGVNFNARGLVRDVLGSTVGLISSNVYNELGQIRERHWADVASTKETFEYDDLSRVREHRIARDAPSIWSSPPSGYSPPPSALDGLQTVLLHDVFDYDGVGNIKSIVDNRDSYEWGPGTRPVTRSMQYDAQYRLKRVDYNYALGGDSYLSPNRPEELAGGTPLPHAAMLSRPAWQSFNYDWFGNLSSSADDLNAHFDRSLGNVQHNTSSQKPGQLSQAASGGAGRVAARYDNSGNILEMEVRRSASCGNASGKCSHRITYRWDELGHLDEVFRQDFSNPEFAVIEQPPVAARSRFQYGVDGRVTKWVSGAEYTVDVFDSLRLVNASYDSIGNDYEQSVETEVVRVPGAARIFVDAGAPNATGSPVHVLYETGDYQGSFAAAIDRDTSELVERTTYLPYGDVESSFRSTRWNGFREELKHTAKELETDFGITYFGARYYSPNLGRWLSADPYTVHAFGSDLNPYAYVGGRTFNAADLLGFDSCTENPNCRQNPGGEYGDAKGWERALDAAGDWFGKVGQGIGEGVARTGKSIGEGVADVATSIFGPDQTRYLVTHVAPAVGGVARGITAYHGAVDPLGGIVNGASKVVVDAFKPGAFITMRGVGIGAAQTVANMGKAAQVANVAMNPVLGFAAMAATPPAPALPHAAPGDLGPNVGKLAVDVAATVAPLVGKGAGTAATVADEVAVVAEEAAAAEGVGAKFVASTPQSAIALSKQLASEAQLGEMAARTGLPISGPGTGTVFRDAARIANTYGGNAADWAKMSSSGFRAADGTTFATHWVENLVTGQQAEPKVVIDIFGRP